MFNFAGDAFDNKTAGLWLGTHTADGGKKAALVVLRGRTGNDAIVLNGGEGENIYSRDAGNKPVFNFAGDAFDGKVAGLWIGAAQGDGGRNRDSSSFGTTRDETRSSSTAPRGTSSSTTPIALRTLT